LETCAGFATVSVIFGRTKPDVEIKETRLAVVVVVVLAVFSEIYSALMNMSVLISVN